MKTSSNFCTSCGAKINVSSQGNSSIPKTPIPSSGRLDGYQNQNKTSKSSEMSGDTKGFLWWICIIIAVILGVPFAPIVIWIVFIGFPIYWFIKLAGKK